MASIAKEHYDGLQRDPDLTEEAHASAMDKTMKDFNVALTDRESGEMDEVLSGKEVGRAIRESAAGKAPGLDGIPTEVWKCYCQWDEESEKNDMHPIGMTAMMTMVFNDIWEHGVVRGTDFVEGWICPIYKKKDQRKIVNYRPKTLLNADY